MRYRDVPGCGNGKGTCLLLLSGALIWGGCGTAETDPPVAATRNPPALADRSRSDMDPLAVATQLLADNDLKGAESAVRRRLLADPHDVRGLELSGDIAARRRDTTAAIQMYRAAVEQSDPPTESLLDKLAVQLVVAGRAFDTLNVLRERIHWHPNTVQTRSEFAGLAAVLGLAEIGVPELRWLSQHGHSDPEAWPVLANPRRVEPDGDFCQTLLKLNPADRRPEFGLACLDAQELKWAKVVKRLRPVMEQHPDFVAAFNLYALALTELNEFDKLPAWQRRVPDKAKLSPEYWLVAGLWAQQQGKNAEAARAFWEAIRLDEVGYPEAMTNLLQALKQMGREEDADLVADQINKYVAMRDAVKTYFEREAKSQQAAWRVAKAMEDVGRLWEAAGWALMATSLPNDRVPDIRQRFIAIRSNLTANTPWQIPELRLESQLDLSDLPMPEWTASASRPAATVKLTSGNFFFADEAAQRGWIHTCEIDPQAKAKGHWIYQSVGGGVAVIDIELDGWPDLAVAMLDGQPLRSNSSPNRLFRNLQGQFVDRTTEANYLDHGFGQGIAIGDFNDDGFPDILDANIGRNRLYENKGDGTFAEVALPGGNGSEAWTSSVVITDIDGDGLADLFQTSYCGGSQVYQRPCKNSSGRIVSCGPLRWEAEKDRVCRGAGDGSFVDVSDQWMNQTSPGRGLGVVAGSFDERPGIDLYVANDMTVNHLWSGQIGEAGFTLTDLGAIRGLGLSRHAVSQASMGIAVGDPDGDGDTDFFLTHFMDDHNTFYEQVGPGLWSDRSFPVGLAEPSQKMLGFGTEWADFDNNGSLELIVVNGHVDEVEGRDVAYRMPPQLFQLDAGRWVELDRQKLGEYFVTDHLSRALATVDVDRDGRLDVAITHLYDPVSLLMNRTTDGGQSIGLELKSTGGQRDAIGATVVTTIGAREVKAQLTAGDGYMCSNQRRITLGTGNVAEANDLVVIWPSGTREKFGTVLTGRDYLLVEGSGEAYEMAAHR